MASRTATNRQQPSRTSPHPAPTTPMDQVQDPLSQVTLPSTEGPGSPMDPNSSFKTEINDDRPSALVIPSSLTPPPSSQVRAAMNRRSVAFSQSQQTAPVSPPATILNTLRDRDVASAGFALPSSDLVRDASPEQLRAMLQTCIAENQKLKMETAHHKLQYNLLSLQADEESKRAVVEHDMVRREVDALRMAEHSRQAKREFGSPSDALTSKYLNLRSSYEAIVEENDSLHKRVRVAKKVIQQKEEETLGMAEEREMLLNRIRENREHFQMLCSPGGIFHGAMTPRQNPPQLHQQQSQSQSQPARHAARVHGSESQHGLSMILQAMSQGDHDNSAPSTPAQPPRSAPRQPRKHSRNAQSMSSLPTTPINRPRGEHSSLLPSVDLVPQTEPRTMYTQQYFAPMTPDRRHRRKSRESTISADESETVAAAAAAARRGGAGKPSNRSMHSRRGDDAADQDVFDSQASQAATDLLRRHPGQSFELVASSGESRDASPIALPAKSPTAAAAAAPATKPRSRLPDSSRSEKRRISGNSDAEPVTTTTKSRRDQHGSPAKKARTGADARRVGLGIQYQ